MDPVERAILYSVQNHGILPLTSTCDQRCLFCSNRQNPKGLKVFRIRPRSLAGIQEDLPYLGGDRVVIGESATRIIEGEPFTHPDILAILKSIREGYPERVIQITTSGSRLTDYVLDALQDLGGVELIISLNSASPENREKVMGDTSADTALKAVKQLGRREIPFRGSLVALPEVLGFEDVRQTVLFLDRCRAETIRVFRPGYTKVARGKIRFGQYDSEGLSGALEPVLGRTGAPVLLEPPEIPDLLAKIEGVLYGTAAAQAGLQRGDVICTVQGREVFCRVDAFMMLKQLSQPLVELANGSRVELDKAAGEKSGVVMNFDLDPNELKDFMRITRGRRVLALTSQLGYKAISLALKAAADQAEIVLEAVQNRWLGGNIAAAGLLVADDFFSHLNGADLSSFDLVTLPGRAFDDTGHDLTGKSYLEVENLIQIPVALV